MRQSSLFDSGTEEITYTQIATFLRCSLEYKLRFIDELKQAPPSGTAVSWGRLLHRIAHQYLELPIGQRSVDFLATRLEEEASRKSLPDAEHQLGILTHSLRPFHDLLAHAEVYQQEAHFRSNLLGFNFVGRADAIVKRQGSLVLLEFKYTDYRESDCQAELDRYLQLILYSVGLGARHVDPVDPVEGIYYFFDSGTISTVALSEHLKQRGKARFVEITDQISESVKKNDFEPTLNRLCSTCGSRRLCSLYTQRRYS